jgi:hypothetical protein
MKMQTEKNFERPERKHHKGANCPTLCVGAAYMEEECAQCAWHGDAEKCTPDCPYFYCSHKCNGHYGLIQNLLKKQI